METSFIDAYFNQHAFYTISIQARLKCLRFEHLRSPQTMSGQLSTHLQRLCDLKEVHEALRLNLCLGFISGTQGRVDVASHQ
jgi:hypothetical protein